MKKIKQKMYPVFTIVLPLLLIGLLSIWFSSIFNIIDYEGNGFLIKLSEITLKHPRRVACIIIFIILLIIIRNHNKEKEYAPSDIYGNYHIYIYYIAWILLGYKKVNLRMKPIPLQFQLLHVNALECFDDTEYSDKEYKYKVNYYGNLRNAKQINIIVADTYPIEIDKVPQSIKENYTIIIKRLGEKGVRIKSKELIDIITKEVQASKNYCKDYNLLLSTPATTNIRIFRQVFQTGQRDNFIINIYQQDNKNEFKFMEKSIRIKC